MGKGTINREYDLCSNMKTNLIPLIMRALQIRNTLRNHVLCIKLSNIKKFDNIPYWYKCEEIGTLIHCSWVCVNWFNLCGGQFVSILQI